MLISIWGLFYMRVDKSIKQSFFWAGFVLIEFEMNKLPYLFCGCLIHTLI